MPTILHASASPYSAKVRMAAAYTNITAEAEAFVKWHAGQLTWTQATCEDRIQLDGSPSLIRAFPTWNARSMFAHIRPVASIATTPQADMRQRSFA